MAVTDLMKAAHELAVNPIANHEPAFLRGMAALIAKVADPDPDVQRSVRQDAYVQLLEAQARGGVVL